MAGKLSNRLMKPVYFFVAVAMLLPATAGLTDEIGQMRSRTVDAATSFAVGSVVEVTQQDLFLRSAPTLNSTVLYEMDLGDQGTVLAGPTIADNIPWYQIRMSTNGTGWASGNYLKLVVVASKTPTVSGGFSAGTTVEVTDPNLYLRSAPGTGSTVLAQMALGTRGTVVAGPVAANGYTWYQIKTSAYGIGWASGKYLKQVSNSSATPTKTPTRPTPTTTAGGIPAGTVVVTTIDDLYLRKSAGLNGAIIGIMPIGTRATVKSGPVRVDNIPWYQISVTGLGTGWSSGNFLREASASPLLTKPSDGKSRLIYNGVSARPEIALTFDAGSDAGYTKAILDLLASYGITASFGITGSFAQANPALIQRMVDDGHQLINHTWDHKSWTGVSASPAVTTASGRKSELTKTADFVYNLTGYRMSPYWRPPYGDVNSSTQVDAFAAGYWQTIMWSCDTLGWNGATVGQILDRCAYPAEAGDIILMHVGSDSNDYNAFKRMISILRSEGFSFVTISRLLQ